MTIPCGLAIGLATHGHKRSRSSSGRAGPRRERSPQAPLLLAPVNFTLIPGTRSVSSLQLTGEPELNTALRFVLRAQYEWIWMLKAGWPTRSARWGT